jgi:hypothetical protein
LKSIGKSYGISLNTIKATAIQLSKSIGVELLSKESDILTLSISGTDQIHSEKILNELIKIYEEDGIRNVMISTGYHRDYVWRSVLFQIMAGLGFAEKWKNYDIFLKEGGYNHVSEEVSKGHILQLFSNVQPPLKFINKNNNNNSYKVIGEKLPLEFTITEDPNSNCILDGYFQSDKYFPKKQPKLNLLEPKNNIISTINKDKLFFIHIRLGDLYGDNDNYKLPPTYYKNGIKNILQKKI